MKRPELPQREIECLLGMARGLTNKAIGAELFLDEDTVKTYAHRLFRRLGAKNRAHAVHLGWAYGLLKVTERGDAA